MGDLARTLAVPAPGRAPTTAEIAREAAASFIADWAAAGEPTSLAIADAAAESAVWLSEQPTGSESVDGDLHFEQVLAGRRHPWTVVDPVLQRRDREYDIGRVLWSRFDEFENDRDVVAAFDAFVEAAEVPPERARAWVVVRCMSYLLWGLRQGLTLDPPKCVRLLSLFA